MVASDGRGAALAGDRILMGAAALPEPERRWLAAAERLPIESIWQGGHSFLATRPVRPSPGWRCMTAWTERVRVGTAILLLPLYHPVIVAKQLADLDAWSGGRRLGRRRAWAASSPRSSTPSACPSPSAAPRTDEAMAGAAVALER